ncbi:unnamed protein product [Prunus armeniaca]
MAGENVARPQCEVARVFGLAGVLTDPVRGRVRPDAQCEVARVFGLAGVLTDPRTWPGASRRMSGRYDGMMAGENVARPKRTV